ncbi:MAG: hypothetical protein ACKO0M_08690 [Cyanobium sp.]
MSPLFLALVLPLLLLSIRASAAKRVARPRWLGWLLRREALLWNLAVGLCIGVSLLRWLMGR